MPYAAVGDTNLHYEEWGSPGGRPLLLLHAALQTGGSMAPVRRALEGAPLAGQAGTGMLDFRMIAPDQRGHGRSVNPGGSLSHPRLADDMVGLMAALGLERPVALGFSLGGMVAMELAVRGLLSGLVVMASRIHPAEPGRKTFDPADIRRRSPVWAKHLATEHLETPWEDLAVQLGRMIGAWPGFAAADLAAIDCPTLVVQGDRDDLVPLSQAEELAHRVPGARLAVIPRTGHPELLYRDTAQRAVVEFLTGK